MRFVFLEYSPMSHLKIEVKYSIQWLYMCIEMSRYYCNVNYVSWWNDLYTHGSTEM